MHEDMGLVPAERIEQSILLNRGHKVILDADLAALYGVETKQLIQAVKRNLVWCVRNNLTFNKNCMA